MGVNGDGLYIEDGGEEDRRGIIFNWIEMFD